ncbi:MAG: radical SAM protein [Candidatus Nanoarchaeia archaeon]|nr:radical SAM protein [Candidatus Nanoarchaeia archaeon]
MKVALIHHPLKILNEIKEFFRISYPLGLMYLASSLEKEGHEVKIIDALGDGWQEQVVDGEFTRIGWSRDKIKKEIQEFNPDVAGVSAQFTSQAEAAHESIDIVKEIDKNIPVMLGGPHASGTAMSTIKDPNVDFIFTGEGELTAINLLKNLKDPSNVKGLWYKGENGAIKTTGPAEVIQELDELPFPAYHLVNIQNYFDAGNKGMSSRRHAKGEGNWGTMFTTRGCPYTCNFCSIFNTMGRRWRKRSTNNVVDEIEFLYNKYGIRTIFFEDDNFTLDMKHTIDILDELKKRNLEIQWQTPNGVRADRLDKELVAKMKESGCTRLRVAVEHGDQKFLNEVIHKRMDLSVLEQSTKNVRAADIALDGFFILGIPGETDVTMRTSIDFMKNLASLGLNPIIGYAIPLPGTEVFEVCKKGNYFTKEKFTAKDYQLGYSREPMIVTPTMSVDRLKHWYYTAFKETILARIKHDPRVLNELNIVQEFKTNPLKASKIMYSYMKRTLFSRKFGKAEDADTEATRSVVDLD